MNFRTYANKHLQEVVCGFNFANGGVVWDSAFFGQFFDKIVSLGFDEREERKGIQINFGDINSDVLNPIKVSSTELESKMLFKNKSSGSAITLGKDFVFFHQINNYKGWEPFTTELIEPGLRFYQELGLLAGAVKCNVIYLNRFELREDEDFSSYFTFLNPIGTDFGTENSVTVHRIMDYNERLELVFRFQSMKTSEDTRQVILECGAITKGFEHLKWQELISITHEPIRVFFESLITTKLKELL